MVVVLLRPFIPRPCTAAEIAHPIVGRFAIGFAVTPDVPVALRTRSSPTACNEPRMPVGRVIGNQIKDDLDCPSMRLTKEAVDIVQVAEEWVNGAVVHYVVA